MVRHLRVYNNKLISKPAIHGLVHQLKETLNFKISNLEISFVSSEQIKQLNKNYLKHNYSTDIVTFGYASKSKLLDGEIIISIDDVCENAKRYRTSNQLEIFRMIIHGILHLLGFNDKTTLERKIMKSKENYLVRKNMILLK